MQPLQPRSLMIDNLRGIVVLITIFGHHFYAYPPPLDKAIAYMEFALEGFIFLAGYSVAKRYWAVFLKHPGEAVRKLEGKTLKLYAVQVLMIFTISVPLYYFYLDEIRASDSVPMFILKSLALLNQIGFIHVLPTFIPLFLISPLLLYGFKKGLDGPILAGSALLFAIGNFHPYLLDMGEKTIFPFILWQIYFVAGCYLGIRREGPAHAFLSGPHRARTALVFFAVMLVLKYSKWLPPGMVAKFPLNALGLLYGAASLYMAYVVLRALDPVLSRLPIYKQVVPMMGRHALPAFVIHIYTAAIIRQTTLAYHLSMNTVVFLVFMTVLLIYCILSFLEKRAMARRARREEAGRDAAHAQIALPGRSAPQDA